MSARHLTLDSVRSADVLTPEWLGWNVGELISVPSALQEQVDAAIERARLAIDPRKESPGAYALRTDRMLFRAVASFMADVYHEAMSALYGVVGPDGIRVYRRLTVTDRWLAQLRANASRPIRVGVYWSWDRAAAEAHWGRYDDAYRHLLLEGVVAEQDVDWVETVRANIAASEESEIRVYPQTTIRKPRAFIEPYPRTTETEIHFTRPIIAGTPRPL